jgi:peptidoglycan/LPS O-acetylase OafA/YrhL
MIWVNSLVQFQFFALGALLALSLNGYIPTLRTGVRMGILLAGFLAWLTAQGAFGIRDVSPSPPPAIPLILGYTLVAMGCALFFLGFLGMPRHWVPKPLAYLGKISYGLYVFHAFAIDCAWKALAAMGWTTSGSFGSTLGAAVLFLLMLAAALVMTILLAMASYRFLEQPFLKLKERFTLVKSRLA